MSKVSVYTLFDRKAREYGQLVTAASLPAMERLLFETVKDSGSTIERYPEDFDLWYVGEFDTESGLLAANADTREVCDNVGEIFLKFRKES